MACSAGSCAAAGAGVWAGVDAGVVPGLRPGPGRSPPVFCACAAASWRGPAGPRWFPSRADRSSRPSGSRCRSASVPVFFLRRRRRRARARAGLRLGQHLRDPAGDLLDRPEPFARRFQQLRRKTRRVALRRGEQRCADLTGHLERGVDELRCVLLGACGRGSSQARPAGVSRPGTPAMPCGRVACEPPGSPSTSNARGSDRVRPPSRRRSRAASSERPRPGPSPTVGPARTSVTRSSKSARSTFIDMGRQVRSAVADDSGSARRRSRGTSPSHALMHRVR